MDQATSHDVYQHGDGIDDADSSQFEVVVDPHELESNFSDMLLQVVGTPQGITSMHAESGRAGGVPHGVLTSALATGWQGLKQQHHRMAACIEQVTPTHTHMHKSSSIYACMQASPTQV